jgi:hypothetical protein
MVLPFAELPYMLTTMPLKIVDEGPGSLFTDLYLSLTGKETER